MCGGMWVLGESKGGAAESGGGVERGSRSEVIVFRPPRLVSKGWAVFEVCGGRKEGTEW